MESPDYRSLIRSKEDTVSTVEWLFIHFVMFVPFLNLLALLYWSLSARTPASKRTFARSVLLSLMLMVGTVWGVWQIESFREFVKGPVIDGLVEFARESVDQYQAEVPRYRIFTDMDGREIEAKVIGFEGSKVIIRRRDGEVYESDFNRFSHPDRDYLIETRKAMEAGR